MSLQMWRGEYDTVIAESLEQAKDMAVEVSGTDESADGEWVALPPDKLVSIIVDDYTGDTETHTVEEWINQEGPGFFVSTEY